MGFRLGRVGNVGVTGGECRVAGAAVNRPNGGTPSPVGSCAGDASRRRRWRGSVVAMSTLRHAPSQPPDPRADDATWAGSGANEQLAFQGYRLRIDAGRGRLYDRRSILIGASSDCDLVLDAPTVSRLHARLEYDGRGYLLTDLGSRNGTTVDGVRVLSAYLGETAHLTFGDATVWFALDDTRVEVELTRAHRLGPLIGRSAPMRELFALIQRVGRSPVSVLVEGEQGAGKELVAEAIHAHSDRSGRPLVVFDCAAVAPDMLEHELFGHVRGAAHIPGLTRDGALGEAAGGTLFLDEVTELPAEVQARLVRVLEKNSWRPVGADASRPLEARIVAATSKPIAQEVELGQFREDLLLRLAVVRLRVPPLRHRPEDIPLLVEHFLQRVGAVHVQIGWDTMRRLQEQPWPGNVRELRMAVERAVALAGGDRLDSRHLTPRQDARGPVEVAVDGERLALTIDIDRPFKDAKARLLEQFESRYWRRLLEATDGNITEAARRGGIHRKSLEYILKKADPGGG